MSYWEDDAGFLRELAVEAPQHRRRLLDIAHDLDNATPDGVFVEQLAGKIEGWVRDSVLPTREYAEKISEELRCLSLALKRDPSQ
jgi:hypothetical protein